MNEVEMISVTKVFHFEAAHAISNHDGKCRNIHGHSYELHVTVSADKLDQCGMVIDFSALKEVVTRAVIDEFDHALILKKGCKHEKLLSHRDIKMIAIADEPSVEVLLQLFAGRIKAGLSSEYKLRRMKLKETASSYAEWEAISDG